MLMLVFGEVKRRERGRSLYSSRGGGGVKSPCYLTASPPIPLPLYGSGAVNVYGGGAINACVRTVPNRLPSPFWHSPKGLVVVVVVVVVVVLLLL